MDPACELQKLYESGIRFSLAINYRGGFTVRLGDYIDHPTAETAFSTVEDAVSWLKVQVTVHGGDASVTKI